MSGQLPLVRLDPRTLRRLIALAALRIALTVGSLLTAYYLLPLDNVGGSAELLYFLMGAAVFAAAVTWQIRSIVKATYPGLRAIEAISVSLSLLVILFAIVYISMGLADPANFSEQLSRTSSLYFTITVLATVGFGDIVARTDAARLVVSLQMLLDLVLLGVIVKLVVGAARTGVERQRGEQDEDVAL